MFKVGQKVKSTTQIPFEGGTLYGILVKIEDTKNIYAPKYVIQSALATSPKARVGMTEASLTDATNDPDFPTGREAEIILNYLKIKPTGGRRKSRKTKKARRSRRRRQSRRN